MTSAKVWAKRLVVCAAVAAGVVAGRTTQAAVLLVEDFNDVASLGGAGWVQTNNSTPGGTIGWFQGNPAVFPAQTGAPDAYVAVSFNSAGVGGDASNWLILPELRLTDHTMLSFYTRSAGSPFPDRLEVRLSPNGASTDVGTAETSVGDFTTLLLTINPSLVVDGYPDAWTRYDVALSGLGGSTYGRLAFRYFVTDTFNNGDYIGIDAVSVVPEPATMLLVGAGVAAFGVAGRSRRRG